MIDDWIGMIGDNNDEGSRPSISRRISCGIDSFKNRSAICIATRVRLVDSSSHTSDSCASLSLSLTLTFISIQIRVSHMCDLHNDNWHRDQVHDGSQLPEQHHVSNGTSDVCDRLDLAHSHAPSSRVSRRLLEASWHVCLSFIFSILSLSQEDA